MCKRSTIRVNDNTGQSGKGTMPGSVKGSQPVNEKAVAQSMVNTANDPMKSAPDKERKVQVIRWIIRAFTNRQPK